MTIKVIVRRDAGRSRIQLAQIVGETVLGLGGTYAGVDIKIEEHTAKLKAALQVYRHHFVLWSKRIPLDETGFPVAIAFFE